MGVVAIGVSDSSLSEIADLALDELLVSVSPALRATFERCYSAQAQDGHGPGFTSYIDADL
jgi:hypothetical protein